MSTDEKISHFDAFFNKEKIVIIRFNSAYRGEGAEWNPGLYLSIKIGERETNTFNLDIKSLIKCATERTLLCFQSSVSIKTLEECCGIDDKMAQKLYELLIANLKKGVENHLLIYKEEGLVSIRHDMIDSDDLILGPVFNKKHVYGSNFSDACSKLFA